MDTRSTITQRKRQASHSPLYEEKSKKQRKRSKHINIEEVIGRKLNGRYIITQCIDQGTFGRVFEAFDEVQKCKRAIKIIKPVSEYLEGARIETNIIKKLQLQGSEFSNIVTFIEDFDYKNSYCLVFEKLELNLYKFLEKNKFQGFEIQTVQSIAKQILQAVAFLHKNNVVHTDLKIENILLVNAEYETFNRDLLEK